MRKAFVVAAVVIVVAGTVAYLAIQSLDTIVRDTIEQRGSELTGTTVRLESVHVSMADGQARLRGLSVDNPPGFTGMEALRLGEIEVKIDTASLAGSPVVIEEIRIDLPRVFFELDEEGRANIDRIRRNAERSAGKPRDGGSRREDDGDTRPSDGSDILLVVDRLSISGGEVAIDARAVGGKVETSALPSFELTAIGRSENGLTPSELGRTIAVALARDVAAAVVASQVERYVGEKLGGSLGDAVRRGGAGAIEKGWGGVLDQLLRKKKHESQH